MCQSCVRDGMLSQETYDKIGAFNEKWPEASGGPGHIVLDDCNVLDGNLKFCIRLIDGVFWKDHVRLSSRERDMLEGLDWYKDHSIDELRVTRDFLLDLQQIPEEDR